MIDIPQDVQDNLATHGFLRWSHGGNCVTYMKDVGVGSLPTGKSVSCNLIRETDGRLSGEFVMVTEGFNKLSGGRFSPVEDIKQFTRMLNRFMVDASALLP